MGNVAFYTIPRPLHNKFQATGILKGQPIGGLNAIKWYAVGEKTAHIERTGGEQITGARKITVGAKLPFAGNENLCLAHEDGCIGNVDMIVVAEQ